MSFCFRLTLNHKTPGLFRFETESTTVELQNGQVLRLFARNASTLAEATSFHFEGCGFADELAAQQVGEWLRLRLRVLNALLGLGIYIPLQDSTSAKMSPAIKDDIRRNHGVVVLDTIQGLAIFPDDDMHCEYVISGQGDVYPSDPTYIFKALQKVWDLNITLDQRTEDALHILNLAEVETSPRAKFLTTYLALETLIRREQRSEPALALLAEFSALVDKAKQDKRLDARDADSLKGSLARLHERSFPSVLMEFLGRVQSPTEIKGQPIRKFFSKCIDIRNNIAHDASIDPNLNLDEFSKGIREFTLGIIWTFHQIPSLSINIPASTVSIPLGGLTIRVV
jgi:hypothetical protein